MKSNSKKWMFGASMLAIACGIGALTGFSGGDFGVCEYEKRCGYVCEYGTIERNDFYPFRRRIRLYGRLYRLVWFWSCG